MNIKIYNLKAKWYRFLSKFITVYILVDGDCVTMVLSTFPIKTIIFDGLDEMDKTDRKAERERVVRDMSLYTNYVIY